MSWSSPDQFQRELDFPGRGLGGSNQTGAGDGVPILVEDGPIIGGRGEVGAVEYIEELRSKLNVEILRDPPDRMVLEQGEIQVREAGPNHRITAQIPPQVRAR